MEQLVKDTINYLKEQYNQQKITFKKYTDEMVNTHEGQNYYLNKLTVELRDLNDLYSQIKSLELILKNYNSDKNNNRKIEIFKETD